MYSSIATIAVDTGASTELPITRVVTWDPQVHTVIYAKNIAANGGYCDADLYWYDVTSGQSDKIVHMEDVCQWVINHPDDVFFSTWPNVQVNGDVVSFPAVTDYASWDTNGHPDIYFLRRTSAG